MLVTLHARSRGLGEHLGHAALGRVEDLHVGREASQPAGELDGVVLERAAEGAGQLAPAVVADPEREALHLDVAVEVAHDVVLAGDERDAVVLAELADLPPAAARRGRPDVAYLAVAVDGPGQADLDVVGVQLRPAGREHPLRPLCHGSLSPVKRFTFSRAFPRRE